MKNIPLIVSGQALVEEDLTLRPVDIVIESGIITAIEENPRAPKGYGSALHCLMRIRISVTPLRWTAG